MLPPVLADSDDEGDDLALPVYPSVGIGSPSTAYSLGATFGYDGSDEKGTGSAENLRSQIDMADVTVHPVSAPVVSRMWDSSPYATKRRHSTMSDADTNRSQDRAAKRSKTLRTYSTKSPVVKTAALDQDTSSALGNCWPLTTSQAVTFSEHSAINSSGGLPAGTPQRSPTDHEPTVVFTDPSSTVEDTSSTRHRLVENALPDRDQGHDPIALPQVVTNESSPSQGAAEDSSHQNDRDHVLEENEANSTDLRHVPLNRSSVVDIRPQEFHRSQGHEESGDSDGEVGESVPTKCQKPRSSPVVRIMQRACAPKPSKHNKKVSETDPIKPYEHRVEGQREERISTSDEAALDAIGLPAECYKPRPSRRRATVVPEEEIDFSLRPEKAAKAKRVKSAPGNAEHNEEQPSRRSCAAECPSQEQHKKSEMLQERTVQCELRSRESTPLRPTSTESSKTSANLPTAKNASPSQAEDDSSQIANLSKDHEFAKPMKPPSKTKKAKRSHTTIFEDHMEFRSSSERSPSLSQQQAHRKSALQDVRNESSRPSQRRQKQKPKRMIDSEDEDEEDELVGESRKSPYSPKKSARGPHPDPVKSGKDTPTREILKDSNDLDAEPPTTDVPPKKRSRGRPRKSAVQESAETSTAKPAPGDEEITPMNARLDPTTASEDGSGQNAAGEFDDNGFRSTNADELDSIRSKATAEQTPRPATPPVSPKQFHHEQSRAETITTKGPAPPPKHPQTAATDQNLSDQTPNPNSHSPIKSSSNVPLRVGLNKRHRIPPLLRTIRPSVKR